MCNLYGKIFCELSFLGGYIDLKKSLKVIIFKSGIFYDFNWVLGKYLIRIFILLIYYLYSDSGGDFIVFGIGLRKV